MLACPKSPSTPALEWKCSLKLSRNLRHKRQFSPVSDKTSTPKLGKRNISAFVSILLGIRYITGKKKRDVR